jgi:erythromycin esterase-like protein
MGSFSTSNIDLSQFYKPLERASDLDPLMDRIGYSKYVLLGEASHGTHEYYTWRAKISKRLIKEKGFSFIAVEGDWPDCFKINRWIKGLKNNEKSIIDVLKEFKRWPTWMWANWEIVAFAEWLKTHNKNLHVDKKIGFYGLDVYSLWESMEIIVKYLKKEDPKTAELAKKAVSCFEPYRERDSYATAFSYSRAGCKEEVISLLQEVRKRSHSYDHEPEANLNAELNSLVVANAEKYYEAMAGFGEDSWNVRDRHMVETLNTLTKFHGPDAKIIVWEHNTHIGDARATDMADSGLINVGQLVREQHEKDGVFLIGFGSYSGSVLAGSNWGAKMQKMRVPEAIHNSIEYKLHQQDPKNKLIIFDEDPKIKDVFAKKTGHRAIGVVYHPEREWGNYVPSKLSDRYDAFLFIDKTKALHPLRIEPDGHLMPETYPFGI